MRLLLTFITCTLCAAGEPGTEPIAATMQASAILHRNALVLVQALSVQTDSNGQGSHQQQCEAAGYVIDAQGTIAVGKRSLIGWTDDTQPLPMLNDVVALDANGTSRSCTLLREEPLLGLVFFRPADNSGLVPLPAATTRQPALGEEIFSLALANTPFGPAIVSDRNSVRAVINRPDASCAAWMMDGFAAVRCAGRPARAPAGAPLG